MDSLLSLEFGVPDSSPGLCKTLSFAAPSLARISTLNRGNPPIKLPSLWGTRVQAESLLMTHPGERQVRDSVGHFLHHS